MNSHPDQGLCGPAPRRRRLLAVALGALAALGLAELGLRLLAADGTPLLVQWPTAVEEIDRRAGRSARDAYATFSYDAQGFRTGSGLPFEHSVLFIGDSFTEGRGVGDEQTFARATERALRRDGLATRSLNAGQRGFGAAQALTVLRRVLAHETVDALVIQVFPMNDPSDNLASGAFGIDDGQLVQYEPARPPWRARISHAVATSWLRHLAIARLASNAMLRGDPAAPYDAPEAAALERALLAEMLAEASRRGIPAVLLLVPTRAVQEQARGAPVNQAEIDRYTTIREGARQLGVPIVDAGEVIPDLSADAATSDGGHFGADGNTRVGDALAVHLAPLLRR